MSVIKDMKPPLTGMAARYETAWNEVVSEQPKWKQDILINGFDVVSGCHVYADKEGQRVAGEVMKETISRAENEKYKF